METNKALVLHKEGHPILPYLIFFFFFFFSKQICFMNNQVCTAIVLNSSLLVISSLCAFYPKTWTGCRLDKADKRTEEETCREKVTLLGQRLAAHICRREREKNFPKTIASKDAEDLLCSLFLYFF